MLETEILLVFVIGIISGFANIVGGGGSLISLPALIFMGLPSSEANGTNRLALMVQSLVAIYYFRRQGLFYPQISLFLGLPAILGAILGAHMAITISDEMFNNILAVVMLVVAAVLIWRPEKRFTIIANQKQNTFWRILAEVLLFFAVGFYGGFIQAGVGFIIIIALAFITGMSLVKINTLKVSIIAIYMFFAFIVFIWSGNVHWVLGGILAAGGAIGAWLGSAFVVHKGDRWIRVFLLTSTVIMAAALLDLHKIIGF